MIRIALLASLLVCAVLPARESAAQEPAGAAARCRVDPDRLWFVTAAAADIAGVDADLLGAIAWVESHNCDRAVSPAGAAGLMQLMPATAARFGVADPFDPAQSALGAARFLAELQSGPEGDRTLPLAELLAAYNAGPAAVAHYGGVPPYAETRDYVRAVLMLYLADLKPPRTMRPVTGAAAAPSSRAPRPDSDAEILAQLGRIRGARAQSQSAALP
ncbi:MAG: lytic transglycosylase domain-containing protein [Steroidobacteraceae bacterium]